MGHPTPQKKFDPKKGMDTHRTHRHPPNRMELRFGSWRAAFHSLGIGVEDPITEAWRGEGRRGKGKVQGSPKAGGCYFAGTRVACDRS